ncbi:MAG: hypothetical protein ACLGQH_06665 [Acidobacteriota bacterium]
MPSPSLPNIRIQAAVAALALLTLAGVVWLGIAVERTRTELADMERSLAALSLAAAAPTQAPPAAAQQEALAKLAADVAGLAAKIDAQNADQAKAASRHSAEIKALAGRIESALAAAKPAAPAKPATAKESRASGKNSRPAGDAPPPYYGPGYPAWPTY